MPVFRHELRSFLYSPLTYVFLCGFALALSSCIFLIGDFYASDAASARLALVFLPWVSLVFVPALAMRAWVDEQNDRSVELYLTLPLSLSTVAVGKFLAGFAVLVVALCLTWSFPATVFFLGEPDAGAMVAAYTGATVFLAVLYSIALFAASFAREPVASFVLALGALFFFLLIGSDTLAQLTADESVSAIMPILPFYSPKTWLEIAGDGLLEVGGMLYSLGIIIVMLCAAVANISLRRRGASPGRSLLLRLLVGGGALGLVAALLPLCLNVTAALDLTDERELSLHPGSLEVLQSVPADTVVTLYWSEAEADVPLPIKSHARRIRRVLDRLAVSADGRLTIRSVDPRPDTEEELEALGAGVRRVPMSSGDHFFLGATFAHGERLGRVAYFDPRRDRMLEYDVVSALNSLATSSVPKIGILSPLLPATGVLERREGLSFVEQLKQSYDVAAIPFFASKLPEGLDLLIVLDASILKKETLYAIDQFVMMGGKLVVLLDPHVRFNRASNQVRPQPSAEVNDISDLLLAYGVRYLGEDVVGDETLASPVSDDRGDTLSFPFWLRVREQQMSSSHPVTAGLNELLLAEAGAFEWESSVPVEVLIETTTNSGTVPRSEFAHKRPKALTLQFAPDGRKRVIAVALSGPFSSAFSGVVGMQNSEGHRGDASDQALVFAVADVDWLADPFALQTVEVGGKLIARPLNDNSSLALNMVEYATGESALLAIRSRGTVRRPFTRVEALFKSAERRYRDQEQILAGKVAQAEEQLLRLVEAMGATRSDRLPDEVEDAVRSFDAELLPLRRELHEVRRQIREQVEMLGYRVTVANLLAAPVTVMLLAAIVFGLRKRRGRRYSRTG